MAITSKFWMRSSDTLGAVNALPTTTTIVSSLEASNNFAATLLRSRFYPSVIWQNSNITTQPETPGYKLQALFVAWYDEAPPSTGSPYPMDQDTRIIATAKMRAHRFPALVGPTSSYYMRWETEEAVQSFAQRKPNPASLTTPNVFAGIFVDDPTFTYYTAHATTAWTFQCFSEALYGF